MLAPPSIQPSFVLRGGCITPKHRSFSFRQLEPPSKQRFSVPRRSPHSVALPLPTLLFSISPISCHRVFPSERATFAQVLRGARRSAPWIQPSGTRGFRTLPSGLSIHSQIIGLCPLTMHSFTPQICALAVLALLNGSETLFQPVKTSSAAPSSLVLQPS